MGSAYPESEVGESRRALTALATLSGSSSSAQCKMVGLELVVVKGPRVTAIHWFSLPLVLYESNYSTC